MAAAFSRAVHDFQAVLRLNLLGRYLQDRIAAAQ
jgi:hypothetical protein